MKRLKTTHVVSFADCDPARLVFYPRYFELFDRATERLFRSVGLPWDEMFGHHGLSGVPLVEVSATFKGPVRFGDTLEVESWIDEWRGTSFVVRHRASNNGAVAVEGREVRVWARRDPDSPKGARAVPVPDDVKDRFRR